MLLLHSAGVGYPVVVLLFGHIHLRLREYGFAVAHESAYVVAVEVGYHYVVDVSGLDVHGVEQSQKASSLVRSVARVEQHFLPFLLYEEAAYGRRHAALGGEYVDAVGVVLAVEQAVRHASFFRVVAEGCETG